MSIDERHRIALHEAARESWGPEIAGTLMEMLPPGGWAEVATKSDLAASVAASRSDLALVKSDLSAQGKELRAEIAELGSSLRVEMAELRATVDRGLRTNMMWTVTTMIAGFGGIAAVTAFTH